jgi:hypothetical protein
MKILIEIDLDHFRSIRLELPLALMTLANKIRETGIMPTQVTLPVNGDNLCVGSVKTNETA